jgi:CheY-like chemotaxis protein/HPt (histidine-containing phosphotransfer) domain-containing protein
MTKESVVGGNWAGEMGATLDLHRLSDLLRGHPLSAGAFMADFLRSTTTDAQQLRAAAGICDFPRVEQLAHRMEGASRMVGARPMAAVCALLGAAGRSGDAMGVHDALEAFVARKQALQASVDALDAESRGPAPPQLLTPGDQLCEGLVFLVVEDHEFQRGVIMRLLRRLGALEARGFADGAEALVAARALLAPAILVLDLAMPRVDGMEVMRIAAQEKLPVDVILHSALGGDLLRSPLQTARSFGGKVLGAVSKPLTAAKLAPLLAEHRGGRSTGMPGPAVPR